MRGQKERPSLPVLVALAAVSLQFGELTDAKEHVLRAGEAAPCHTGDRAPASMPAGGNRIRPHLSRIGARQRSYAFGENRGLLYKGMLFNQTSSFHFAEGFEPRRRNITMLFRRGKRRSKNAASG